MDWLEKTETEIVEYVGETCRTRGEYGEEVRTGRLDSRGVVWVWDSGYGWSSWGSFNETDWRKTGCHETIEGPKY